jgi:hypothetical protein
MTPPIIRVFCPGCGKWTKTNRDSSGVLACTECKAGFRSDDNLMNAQTYIRKLRAERDELRVELDKADGAGTDLLAENERLRAELERMKKAVKLGWAAAIENTRSGFSFDDAEKLGLVDEYNSETDWLVLFEEAAAEFLKGGDK